MFAIGASLREARVKRDLAPADVQKALRIRERYLQALEDEQWQLLPGDAYAKGFLRAYADFLGLDGNLYVDEYVSRFRTVDERPLALQSLARVSRRHRRSGLLGPLLAVLAIGAIVAVIVWQLEG
jgi:cytoskeleton protein RodZ